MSTPQTRVFLLGNADLAYDSLPLRLLPQLEHAFPAVSFETLDPNEEWDIPMHPIIIDTVVNLGEVRAFHDLDAFMAAPRMTCHDFDAYANLTLMKKLGMLSGVTIIGLPPVTPEDLPLPTLIEVLGAELEKEY